MAGRPLGVVFMILCAAVVPCLAQEPATRVVRLEARPAAVELRVGDSAELRVSAVDASGRDVAADIRVSGPRTAIRWADGRVTGLAAGDHELVATLVVAPGSGLAPVTLRIPVRVDWPRAARIEITTGHGQLYEHTTLPHSARVRHEDGSERPGAKVQWLSSAPAVATVDEFGNVTAQGTGVVRITAMFDGVGATITHQIRRLDANRLEIRGGGTDVRTGDVQPFRAVAIGSAGRVIDDLPVSWSVSWEPDGPAHVGSSAPSQVRDGRFVADVPGIHTVVAVAGPWVARRTLRVSARSVVQKLNVVGVGSSSRVRTTDLWPFQGRDGRDYALTGAKMSDGHAFVWDITDPANIVKTDSIRVDARSVNDVKVSPDSRYGVITREGASDRRNGVVILDLASPAHPKIAAIFDDGLTGGVHNVFATDDHLFAVSGGDKYVILDVRDIYAPRRVGEYDHPDSRIHDVWVHDGLAYSAEWQTGVVVVDVGNGRWGGTIEKPVLVTRFALPTGATHAVFPYRQSSTGRFYLFVGDEIMTRTGLAMEGPAGSWPHRYDGGSYAERYDPATGGGGVPLATQGYVHIVDFTDPAHPELVARYEVSEYGTHNIWVENDLLYQAYYEGGLRVVDVAGELMGNLYTQGREVAVFKPFDPNGYVANSPMVWSAIPYKGHIFFADTNSGIWAVRIEPKRPVS